MAMFQDRREAGCMLGERLSRLGLGDRVVVRAVASGGIPVAHEIAKVLGAPLDVLLARKVRAPGIQGYGLGAVVSGGVTVFNEELLAELRLTSGALEPVCKRALAELERREQRRRNGDESADIVGKTVVLVDDGVETGATLYAAVLATRALAPSYIVCAVPTSARDSVARLEEVADRVVALATPQPYRGVDAAYAENLDPVHACGIDAAHAA